ncbi:MFS transporter [Bradyrhizobium sp. Pear76]|uniref:MFS transporter n=1 Tax=Bradyrhizobium oropedii TaxID=1571201 RepID=UPI001E3ECA65|nr:MFS transporter [Bradyrhizobium oropedii]MCC8960969.1 MFS transporter [Bradyrhizobium oropedii]
MARQILDPGWKVVIGSGVGISFGAAPIFTAGFAHLTGAMAQDYGWSQVEVARAATIVLSSTMIAYLFCAWPLDRLGSRRFALISIALFAVSLAVLSQVGNALWQFYLAAALFGFVGAGTNVVSYAKAISRWFDERRGLALGLAASAQAGGSFVVPLAAHWIIASYGWSACLLAFAAFEVVVCLPLVAWLVADGPPAGDPASKNDEPRRSIEAQAPEAGISAADIIGTPTFWKLALCFAVIGMSFYAIAPNVMYILKRRAEVSAADVAWIQAAGAVAALFGRIVVGYLLDRLHARVVGILTVLLMALSALLNATANAVAPMVVASILMGFAISGEADLMPYLAGRYFGTRSVSKVFSWLLFAFCIGAAIGPVAFVWLSTLSDSVVLPLLLLSAVQIVPVMLFLSLGRYRTPPERIQSVAVALT